MKINREDVVQAALIVERWCAEHNDDGFDCDCPFADTCWVTGDIPADWNLEEFLRTRGLKHDD